MTAPILGRSQPLRNKMWPKLNGPRGLNVTLPLATNSYFTYKINMQQAGIEWITGVFIDNSANLASVQIGIEETGQRYTIPSQSQASFTLLGLGGDAVTIGGYSTGGVDVPIILTNVEGTDVVWSVIDPGATVVVTPQPLVGTFVEAATQAITLGGTAQSLFGANASRRRLIVYNFATAAGQGIVTPESIFIRFTGTAGVNTSGSLEITPGGVFDSQTGPVSGQAVSIIAATTAHRFTALSM